MEPEYDYFEPRALTSREKDAVLARLKTKMFEERGHVIWNGAMSNGYPRTRLVGKHMKDLFGRKTFIVTAIVLSIKLNQPLLTPKWGVSHLCHRNKCCLKEHLVYEPIALNEERKNCNKFKRCLSPARVPHDPPCIF